MPRNMPVYAKHPGIKVPSGQANWYIPTEGQRFYTESFTAQTTVTILGTTHHLGTVTITPTAFDTQVPPVALSIASSTVDPVTYDVTVNFAAPATGTITLQS